MTKTTLKIGLLIDSYDIPLWVYQMIKTVHNSSHSKVILVVRKEVELSNKKSLFTRFWKKRNELLFLLYSKLESRFITPSPNAFELKNLKDFLTCPEIVVYPKESDRNDLIFKDDIEKIKSYDVDVIIKLGFGNLKGDILNSSKCGVWSYHHADIRRNRGEITGVWEMLKNWDEIGVALQVLTDDFDDRINLHESFYQTDNQYINRNKSDFYWKAKSILPGKLEELSFLGKEEFFLKHKKENTKPLFYDNKLYKIPTNLETLKGLSNLYWIGFKKIIKRKFFFEQWILLYRLDQTDKISKSFYKFKQLLPPKDRFWADPFIIKKNNRYYIFIEELLYSENKGKISVIEMDEYGNSDQPKTVLETDYHLSYPFLIEENDILYMLPETMENNTIELYKCSEFPNKWELKKVLLNNIKALDSTILKHNGKFWLFTNILEYNGTAKENELYLFYSDSLFEEEWIAHPKNPIVINHKFTRPAGNIFVYNDRIFRPAQDCSKHYGYGMQVREIITLNENEYEEQHIQSIYPNWDDDLLSTHTYNSVDKLTFIDAQINRRR